MIVVKIYLDNKCLLKAIIANNMNGLNTTSLSQKT